MISTGEVDENKNIFFLELRLSVRSDIHRNILNISLIVSLELLIAVVFLAVCQLILPTTSFAAKPDDINQKIKSSGGRWQAARTSVSELTKKEMEARLLPGSAEPIVPASAPAPLTAQSLPTSLDWRNYNGHNYVTPVKNQGNYGSCWAHANTATLESYALRRNAALNPVTFDISEQVMVSCANSGGIAPYDFLEETGLPQESCYGYVAGPGSCSSACPNWQSNTTKIGGWGSVAMTLEAIKSALYLYGPIVADLYPDDDFFSYSSGVFSTTNSGPAWSQGHAVEVIGYNDEPSCIGPNCGYFIAKNSWGTSWGESGFFRIAYSQLGSQIKFGTGAIAFLDSCDYNLSTQQSSFDFRGGTGFVTNTPTPGICSWKVAMSWYSWLFVTSGTSYEGSSANVDYRVDENLEETARSGTINVAGKTVTVNQSGRPKQNIYVYWKGSGRGELVIKETWRGRSTYHLCDTFTDPAGVPFCSVSVLDGTEITLTARGYPGTNTSFIGYSDAVSLPCTNDTSRGECTFIAHDFRYITAAFSEGSGAPATPTNAATPTAPGGSQNLEILAPSGGTTLKAGRSTQIRFRSGSDGVFQAILTRNGKRAAVVAANVKKKAGITTLSWKIPPTIASGNDYRISVTNKSCANCAATSSPFNIVGKGLVLSSPVANATMVPGSELRIVWGQGGKLCPALKLQLLAPAGAAINIQSKLKSSASGSYRWNIPPTLTPGSGYRIKLSCVGASGQSTSGPLIIPLIATSTPVAAFPTVALPTAAPTATPTIVPTIPEAVSIGLLGLGDSRFVTNQSSPTLRGSAQAGAGIDYVRCSNLRTGAATTASGTQQWQVNVNLLSGDNKILCQVRGLNGVTAEQNFTLVYYSQNIFDSTLELSEDVAFIQEAQGISAKIAVNSAIVDLSPQITLVRTDSTGTPVEQTAVLADNGTEPDEVALDLTYSAGFSLTPAAAGDTCYRAKVLLSGQAYFSEMQCVWATTHLSDADLTNAAAIGSLAKENFDRLVNNGSSLPNAAVSVAAMIKNANGVSEAGSNGMDGVWWVTSAGLFGGYSAFIEGKRAGPDPEDEVQSPKGVIISPFINNLRYPVSGSFGAADDYNTTWSSIRAQQSCNLFCYKSFRNVSSENRKEVKIETFKQLDEYGYIHISSHGNIYYNGLLNKWRDEWGKDLEKTLRGYYASVGVHSGYRLDQLPDGTWRDRTAVEKDLKSGRMALFSWGGIHLEPVLLPGFFRKYVGKLPNSVVVVATCYSMFNHSLADAFLQNGAAAVLGYTMPVSSAYAGNTTTTIANKLIEGKTIRQSYDAAVQTWTDHDGDAYLRLAGNDDTVVYQGGVKNGDFEAGKLAPWEKEAGTRAFILPEFAGVAPFSSAHFGYLTTGPGSPNNAGIITQAVCVPPTATTLSFSYRYLSQEFAGRAADVFLVTICPIDYWTDQIADDCVSTGATWSQDTFTLDLAGGLQLVSDLGDGTRMTPSWLSGAMDVTAYRNKSVSLSLWAADTGADLLGDTSVLVDDVQIQ